ncbi:peptidase S8, partial [Bacillus atrophaeus]|nr:peptidase S8 [Bacillus atrophaeus]
MKRTKVSSFWASVLIFTLVISLFTPFREVSASGNTIEDASILENGKEQTGMLKEPEQSQWYQISPGKDEIFNDSHMALSVKSESFLNVSVYASKEKAQKDETFDMYRSYTAQEGKSEINIPHAWKGPYYIKV